MGLTSLEKFEVRCTKAILAFSEVFLHIPCFGVHKNISKRRGLCYGNGKRTKLDVYRKEGCEGSLPLFIYIHGGGFLSGIRSNRRFYCYNWVDDGYVAANIDYDYALDAEHPEHIREIFKGIEFVLERAEEFGIDTRKIVVAGDSAGGYFASLVSVVSVYRDLYETLGIDFKFKDDFKVSACVTLSGIFDPVRAIDTRYPQIGLFTSVFFGRSAKEVRAMKGDESLRVTYATDARTGPEFPPTFIVASKGDRLKAESETLRDELAAAGARYGYFLCTGINGVHAGALACELARSGRECLAEAQKFAKDVTTRAAMPPVAHRRTAICRKRGFDEQICNENTQFCGYRACRAACRVGTRVCRMQ